MPLRPAEDADLVDFLEWRNHPANRQVSIHQHVIEQEEHNAWWKHANEDPSRRVLVFECAGRKLGIVNFTNLDFGTKTGTWGFYLDRQTVDAEGLGFTAWIQVMRDATAYAFDVLGLDTLEGEVLAANEAVRQMNRRFRFVEGTPEWRVVEGRRISVIPIRLRREDRLPSERE